MNEQPKKSGNYITQAWLVIVLALLYGSALAGVQMGFGPMIEANKRNETFGQITNLVPSSDYDQSLAANEEPLIVVGLNGKEVAIYRAVDTGGKQVGWVLPASGRGFADRIELLIGVNTDLSTITGLFVLDQKETPGLGDFITGSEFRERFNDQPTDKPLTVVTTDPAPQYEIQALTGATISSESVSDIVNKAIENLKNPILDRAVTGENENNQL